MARIPLCMVQTHPYPWPVARFRTDSIAAICTSVTEEVQLHHGSLVVADSTFAPHSGNHDQLPFRAQVDCCVTGSLYCASDRECHQHYQDYHFLLSPLNLLISTFDPLTAATKMVDVPGCNSSTLSHHANFVFLMKVSCLCHCWASLAST